MKFALVNDMSYKLCIKYLVSLAISVTFFFGCGVYQTENQEDLSSNSKTFSKQEEKEIKVECDKDKAKNQNFSDGSSTELNPYQIWSETDFDNIDQDLNSMSGHYILCKDLNFDQYYIDNAQFSLGKTNQIPFKGTLNGLHHSIENFKFESTVPLSGLDLTGIFSETNNAKIQNLKIKSAKINIKGLYRAGILVGKANNTIIKNIEIDLSTLRYKGVGGGLVGLINACNLEKVTVKQSQIIAVSTGGIVGYSAIGNIIRYARVNNSEIGGSSYVGGIAGTQDRYSIIEKTAAVENRIYSEARAGGVVANLLYSEIIDSYSSGEIRLENNSSYYAGGLVASALCSGYGNAKIENTYSDNKIYYSGVELTEKIGGHVGIISENCDAEDVIGQNSFTVSKLIEQSSGIEKRNYLGMTSWDTIDETAYYVKENELLDIDFFALDVENIDYFYDVNNPPLNTWAFSANVWDISTTSSFYDIPAAGYQN